MGGAVIPGLLCYRLVSWLYTAGRWAGGHDLAQGGRVSNEVEGRGVFRQLVDHCRGRARAAGCVRELMTTNHMNKHIYTDSYKAEKTTIIKKVRNCSRLFLAS